jgi:NAD(P)-dependent dehydrogenase (short-subunit alcohol dehydrogenase family)
MAKEVALVVGVGPGLGAALARRFAQGGLAVAMAARNPDKLDALAREVGGRAYACDAADAASVDRLFEQVERDRGAPTVAIYNAGAYAPGAVVDIQAAEFERCWRILCLGGFLLAQRAARSMAAAGRGTILFTGATASLRGGANFANLAVGKFGLRAVVQSMARELGPKGIHVAHVVIDGQIRSERYAHLEKERPPDGLLDPAAIAESYWHLHQQPRSAWTLELDLRPWVEKF